MKLMLMDDFMKDDFSIFLIDSRATVKDAMSKLESLIVEKYQSLYVVDQENKLLGTLSSSDIRRELIAHDIAISDNVTSVMNHQFTVFEEGRTYTENELKKLKKFHFLPVINENGKILHFEYVKNLLKKKNKVILMAGGLGSRLKELTITIPKPMLKIGDRPLLETVVKQFSNYNFNDFFISVNYIPEQIMNYFGSGKAFNVNIQYLLENKRLGTAGCLSLINETMTEPFFLMNSDILTNIDFEKMLDFHIKNDFEITIATVEHNTTIPYGVLQTNVFGKIESIKEKPIISSKISGGVYVLNPDLIDLIPKDTFFDITSLFDILLKQNRKIGAFEINEYWIDVGSPENFHQANVDFSNIFSD